MKANIDIPTVTECADHYSAQRLEYIISETSL